MSRTKKYNTSQNFENLYSILSSQRFLRKEGLGGELPFFIHSYPVDKLTEVTHSVPFLVKRLQNSGIEICEVNLYKTIIDILQREGYFDKVVEQESRMPKRRLLKNLSGPLNIDAVVIPEIHKRLAETSAKIIFITGIEAAFPVIRSHSILNNLETLVDDLPLVMFFAGEYNNRSLTLFNLIKDDNYYRAHNLNEYQI
jgi:hypothetical protein